MIAEGEEIFFFNGRKLDIQNANRSSKKGPGSNSDCVEHRRLFICGLDDNIDDLDLANHFRIFGEIVSAYVIKNHFTGNSKGFGYVIYKK